MFRFVSSSSWNYRVMCIVVFSFVYTSTILVNAFHPFQTPTASTKKYHPTSITTTTTTTTGSMAPAFVPFGHNHVNGIMSTVVSSSSSSAEMDSDGTDSKRLNTRAEHDDDDCKQVELIRKDWIENSIQYYSKVMREERRRSIGQFKEMADPQYYKLLAKKHYFALRKVKDGKPEHAEYLYRRIISELLQEQNHNIDHNNNDNDNEKVHCDHSKLAVTTLLLALHLQRNNASPKKTRSVFLNFFRIVTSENDNLHEECACSAKVLQAFALFEMKQGNSLKSLELVMAAIKLDPTLQPVLNWKQFRDAMQRRKRQLTTSYLS